MNDGRQISRGARTAHEVERLSKRIAVLQQRLSVLKTKLSIPGRYNRLRIGLGHEIGLERVGLYVRRPIAARYQTPPESGNRRAFSRT
jgi:hypothetical protein